MFMVSVDVVIAWTIKLLIILMTMILIMIIRPSLFMLVYGRRKVIFMMGAKLYPYVAGHLECEILAVWFPPAAVQCLQTLGTAASRRPLTQPRLPFTVHHDVVQRQLSAASPTEHYV